ncbi:MAG: hypothetical protein RLZZ524_2516 [Pseudomonadota bacterium]
MNLRERQDRLMVLRTQATEALEEIRSNTDDARTSELEQRHDNIMAEFDREQAAVEREERHARTLARFDEREEERARREREGRRPGSGSQIEAPGADGGQGDPSYRSAFNAYIAAAGNVGLLSPEQRSVLNRGYQTVAPGEGEQRALTAGTTTAGGYTVPTELMPRLIEQMAAFGPMLDPSWTFELVTDTGVTMTMPTINETAKGSDVAASTEGATLTDDGGVDPVFGQKSLEAYAYNTEWIRVSLELAQDSSLAMENLLIRLLANRLARKGNTLLTTGDGTGDPNGIITAASSGVTAALTSAVTWDELLDLEHSVDQAYRELPTAGYMFRDSTLKALRKLKDGDGTYIWQAGNVQAGVPNLINGKAYRVNPDIAAMATGVEAIVFGDMKSYMVRKVGQPLIAAIQDKDFWPGFGVAGYWRIDGELVDTAAVKTLTMA